MASEPDSKIERATLPDGIDRQPLSPTEAGDPSVFRLASVLVGLLLGIGVAFPDWLGGTLVGLQSWITGAFGWFYALVVTGLLIVSVYLACSRHGLVRLGADDARPEFGRLTWLSMLFATGMGIGLMFFAVAEPMQHYAFPPDAQPQTIASARDAMAITFFHWGLHAWAIYALVGLSMAYFCFRRGLPLSLRSGLGPVFGKRMQGPLGSSVDVLTICATLFGIATSLGFGVLQINAGLHYLTGIPQATWIQLVFIMVSIGLTMISVGTGLNRGIRRLSELNVVIAMLLMLFVLSVGPTRFLFSALAENVGHYFHGLVSRSLNVQAYESDDWVAQWTLFYWAWWISWSPFVGLFIARISRGRTIREFVTGVLLVPSALCFLWMTVFGNTAIALDRGVAAGKLSAAVAGDVSVTLFQFFDYLPFGTAISALAVLLILLFFVTSADSGAYVIDMIASGGDHRPRALRRVYWCMCIGMAAGLLLYSGGLAALQTAALITALPFAVVLVLLAVGLLRDLGRTGGNR